MFSEDDPEHKTGVMMRKPEQRSRAHIKPVPCADFVLKYAHQNSMRGPDDQIASIDAGFVPSFVNPALSTLNLIGRKSKLLPLWDAQHADWLKKYSQTC